MRESRILDSFIPPRSNRATRRACAKRGHDWRRYGDGSVRCSECGESA